MKGIFRKLLTRKKPRPFYAWQVEITTRCNLSCAMCVRSGREDRMGANMALNDFRRLVPLFNDVENVVLEGWGEPLLHPDLYECIRLVKQSGAAVGFVTNGRMCDDDSMGRLLDLGIDFLGFSFAGSTAAVHNRIRAGSDFHELVERVGLLSRRKDEHGLRLPRVHLVYLMVKDNMEDLPAFMTLAGGMGVSEVVLVNEVVAVNTWQREQRVFGSPEAAYYESVLRETAIRAAELGIRLRRPSLFPGEVTLCDENPLRNLYISVEGEVSPCVYLNPPPGDLDIPWEGCQVSFGNIFHRPFEEIWNDDEYLSFRGRFEKRKRTLDYVHARIGGMGIDFPSTAGLLEEAPDPCKKCVKIMGA